MELSGIQGWKLTRPQKEFLLEGTEEMLNRLGAEWFKENQWRLREELRIVFKEL